MSAVAIQKNVQNARFKKNTKKNFLKQFVENKKYQVRCANVELVHENKILARMHNFLEISEDSKYDDVEISDKKYTQKL